MLEMADAISEIEKGDQEDKEEKQKVLLDELIKTAPVALTKLTNKRAVTKKDIVAILYVRYNKLVKIDKYLKPVLMQILADCVSTQPAFVAPADPKYIIEIFGVSTNKEASRAPEKVELFTDVLADVDVNLDLTEI